MVKPMGLILIKDINDSSQLLQSAIEEIRQLRIKNAVLIIESIIFTLEHDPDMLYFFKPEMKKLLQYL